MVINDSCFENDLKQVGHFTVTVIEGKFLRILVTINWAVQAESIINDSFGWFLKVVLLKMSCNNNARFLFCLCVNAIA